MTISMNTVMQVGGVPVLAEGTISEKKSQKKTSTIATKGAPRRVAFGV